MRLEKFYYFINLLSLLSAAVNALAEVPLKIVEAEESVKNAATSTTDAIAPADQLVKVVVEPQGHENVGARKARQFGFPGFGYGPFVPRSYYGGGYGGGFGGGFGGGGGFQRTRVVTRTRVVNRVRGGGFYGGGGYGGGFYG